MLRQVLVEYDGIERLVLHGLSPGEEVPHFVTTIHTVTTSADLPEGPSRVPRISYLSPYLLSCPAPASCERARFRRSVSRRSHVTSVYPRTAKNAALNLPIGCDLER